MDRAGVVLLVDDEPDNLDVFRITFEDDFIVHTAASGEEALTLLEETNDIEVVVADLRMPGMNGLDLLETCRSWWPHMGRVLLTAHTHEDLLVESINRQVLHRFISKPWEYESMLEILKSGVTRTRLSLANTALERQVNTASQLAMLGELSAALMHDMAQPLQVIESGIGLADEIVRGDERTISEEIVDLREAISDAGTALRHLKDLAIRHLKDLAITIKGLMRQRETQLTPARLEQVVSDLDVLLAKLVQNRRVELINQVPPGLPEVMIDRVQVAQVVLNLAANACDAMAEQEQRRLTIGVQTHPDGSQSLVVSDNGPGIPTDVRDQMFDAFFTTKEEGKGTGLGLAIVKRIIDAHRGDLDVSATPGGGATFRIRFPGVVAHDVAA